MLEASMEEGRKNNQTVWAREMLPARVQASDHMCQIRFHERLNPTSEFLAEGSDYTWPYILFDDLRVAANPDLGQSLLHYAGGWQVLYEADPVVSR